MNRASTDDLDFLRSLKAGDPVQLSGTVYTARDAAHLRIMSLLRDGKELPFPLENAFIYFAGPTPARPGTVIGSCGPTTSARMDAFTPELMDRGLFATIGKGERSESVVKACGRNKGIYLCAIGGAGAMAAKCITKCEVIAFDDLGCESVKRLEFENFPLISAIDSEGNSIFRK